MAEHTENAAERILVEQTDFALSSERWEAFLAALDAPPKDIPALRRLLTEEGVFDGE